MTCLRAEIRQLGGPEVIEWVEEDIPNPGPGEVLIQHSAIGLNFIDTYHRGGLYPIDLPSGLGLEAAGTVTALGEGVAGYAEGDRVAYMGPGLGAYATHRVMPADALFKLPDDVSDDVAAAAILKAATTEGLVERCADVNAGDTVLVHAAAGGVGLIMVQWLKALGVNVIGTVSSDAKEVLAREAGSDHVIRYDREEIAPLVRDITGGKGVPVVFDGVGKATFEASLDSMSPRGLLVSFGNASGAVEGVSLGILAQKGSLFVTRPTLMHYYMTPEDRSAGIARVWDMLSTGKVKITIGQTYALKDAAQAHIDLEARRTTGSTILRP
ncbi:quinone oxidoreductase [Altererythrobacter sp.]|uniref:quinone oxidoreductase family protein n=1 Tax=Altererythrobacter sp. TaxID=1872480 RepID=UPI001B0CDAC4|nr:quinone oxidoreductase [Altererythrobacter sp.]MBO6608984.1 quinone oxidoreductase [Altererythrobacter sp.]MBO6642523.1 quinone oxidoreductase [Altererythrobacter sp.]MBO6708969.1 quinone oxidoreductase [Altererythrobacter sp.]